MYMVPIMLTEPTLVAEIQQVAEQTGLEAAEVLAEAVRLHLAHHRQNQIAIEAEAWYRLPSEKRKSYAGQFVAVRAGQIVGSHTDRVTLYLQMRERFGRQPVLIVEGGEQPMPTYRVSGLRHARGHDE